MIIVFLCYLCNVHVFLQYIDTVGWVFWPVKIVARITYTVLVETLNPAHSISLNLVWRSEHDCVQVQKRLHVVVFVCV